MIAIFRKELRENAKWAALIFGVIAMLAYTIIRRRSPYLMFELSTAPMIFFAPLAGLLLGVAQTLFETRQDNWAFVVHRPVSRPAIFAAKCAAGLLLLYTSLELPCLLSAAWAERPGHLRMPFQPRMILPSLAVALNAGAFYFVGIILTLRKARWLGTRLLPLGWGIACSFALRFAPEFWQAMVFVVVGHLIGALAAWGAFSTAGDADRGLAPRLGLGAMIYAGALGIGVGVVGIVGFFHTTTSWSWWRMDRNGNMAQVSTTLHNNSRTTVVTDLAGRPLPQYEGIDLDDPAYADRFVHFDAPLLDDRLVPWPESSEYYRGSYRTALPGIIALRAAAGTGVRLRMTGLFDVPGKIIDLYDSSSRILVGKIGPAGFTPGRATPAEFFPGEPLNPSRLATSHILAFESAVYWLELDHRRVRKLYTPPVGDAVVSTLELPPAANPTVVIATCTQLLVLQPSGEVRLTTRAGIDMRNQFYIPAILPSNQHLVVRAGGLVPDDTSNPEIIEFADDGQVARRINPPKFHFDAGLMTPRTSLLGFIYPLGGLPLYRPWIFNWIFDLNTSRGGLFLGWVLGSSIFCGLATIALGRRYGFGVGRIIAWSAANALLGPASFAAMAGLYQMPARERCAACGGARLVGKRLCPRCAAPVAPTALDGCEIFEPITTAPVFA